MTVSELLDADRPFRSRPLQWLTGNGGAWAAVTLITIAALGLRLWGIRWGLPSPLHLHSYHPDEWSALAAAIAIADWDFNPHFYNYGLFHQYLVAVVVLVADFFLGRMSEPAWVTLARMHFDARLVTVTFGVATVPLVFLLGRSLYGKAAGVVTAAIVAVAPLHAVQSHYATVDVPLAFWVALSLLFAAQILRSRELKWYILAGVAAGLAAGTKYNGIMALLGVLGAHAAAAGDFGGIGRIKALWNRRVATAGAAAIATFAVTNIYCFIDFHEFLGALMFEAHHMRTGDGPVALYTPAGWIFHATDSLRYGLGWPIWLVALAGAGWAMVRREKGDWLLLAYLVPFYLLVGSWKVRYMRYMMPFIPILAILAARVFTAAMAEWREKAEDRPSGTSRLRSAPFSTAAAVALGAFAVFALGYGALCSAAWSHLMAGKDVRDRAFEVIRSEVSTYETVGLIWKPWFPHPPIERNNAWNRAAPLGRMGPYPWVAIGYDAEKLERKRPPWLIVTDIELIDHLRAGRKDAIALVEAIKRNYARRETFREPLQPFGLNLDADSAAQDWHYQRPVIILFKRAESPAADDWHKWFGG